MQNGRKENYFKKEILQRLMVLKSYPDNLNYAWRALILFFLIISSNWMQILFENPISFRSKLLETRPSMEVTEKFCMWGTFYVILGRLIKLVDFT